MRKEAQGISSEEMSGHIQFMKVNWLHAIFKLRNHVEFHVAAKSSYILGSIVQTENIEIRQAVLKRGLKQWEIIEPSATKRGLSCGRLSAEPGYRSREVRIIGIDWKKFGVLDYMGCGHTIGSRWWSHVKVWRYLEVHRSAFLVRRKKAV